MRESVASELISIQRQRIKDPFDIVNCKGETFHRLIITAHKKPS